MRVLVGTALCFSSLCCGGGGDPATVASSWPVSVEFPRGPEIHYPRVVLVTIDTLRADHVSAYGYRRATMPFFDSLAAKGVLFTDANATVAHTAPSHTSMLTGLPTMVHGVHHNGYRLDEGSIDLARVFGAAGYETAACVNERFLERIAHSFGTVHVSRGRGAEVEALAEKWLHEERHGERFFLWMHLFDPHRWKQLVETNGDPPFQDESPESFASYVMELHGLDKGGVEGLLAQHWETKDGKYLQVKSLAQYLKLVESYDKLVRYADAQLAALHRAVEALALPGPTLWIVTADHGEGLASHGHDTHIWNIYQEQLHVPLLVFASDGSLGPARVSAVVSHLDLYPTLVEALGGSVRAPAGLVDGRSLWPLLRGEKVDWSDRAVFSQRKPLPEQGETEITHVYSLQSGHYKLLRKEGKPDEFYDLVQDPRELDDRAKAAPPEREALSRELEKRLRVFEANAQGKAGQEIPTDLLEELHELGY